MLKLCIMKCIQNRQCKPTFYTYFLHFIIYKRKTDLTTLPNMKNEQNPFTQNIKCH